MDANSAMEMIASIIVVVTNSSVVESLRIAALLVPLPQTDLINSVIAELTDRTVAGVAAKGAVMTRAPHEQTSLHLTKRRKGVRALRVAQKELSKRNATHEKPTEIDVRSVSCFASANKRIDHK